MDHSIAQPKMPYFEHQLPVEKRCVLHALNNVLQIGKDHAITCEDFVDIVKTFYPMGHMITKIASFNYNTLCSPASDGICAQDSWSFSIALEWLERNVERSDSHTPVYKELKVENNDPEILFTQKGHYYIFVQLKKDEEENLTRKTRTGQIMLFALSISNCLIVWRTQISHRFF